MVLTHQNFICWGLCFAKSLPKSKDMAVHSSFSLLIIKHLPLALADITRFAHIIHKSQRARKGCTSNIFPSILPPSCSGPQMFKITVLSLTYSNIISCNTFRMRVASDTHSFSVSTEKSASKKDLTQKKQCRTFVTSKCILHVLFGS